MAPRAHMRRPPAPRWATVPPQVRRRERSVKSTMIRGTQQVLRRTGRVVLCVSWGDVISSLCLITLI